MQKIILPIDTKSLYYNIKNDNLTGHTATVATPIKQGNSINEALMNVYKIPMQVDFQSKPNLINELTKNSKSQIKITNVFSFKNISVNYKRIETDKEFCFYIKEEIDPNRVQFGRLKLHYPISLKYDDNDCSIDNKKVINVISEMLKNYAFIITSFDYDFDEDVLNFNAVIVGENQIPYSKVFIKNKGVGNKYSNIFNEYADSYDMEIISLKKYYQQYNQNIDPENYGLINLKCEEKVFEIVDKYLEDYNCINIINLKSDFSYSLYDYRYEKDGIIKYLVVAYTSTNIKYFNISSKQLKFINDFEEETKVMLITDLLNEPKINIYTREDLNRFSKSINSLMLKEIE